MQQQATPVGAGGSGRSALPVLLGGLASTALTLVGVYLLSAHTEDFQIMGWYANYVIPVGAILVGFAASSGYGLGSWLAGVKVSGGLLLGIMGLQVGAYFAGQYIEFRSLGLFYEDGTPVDFVSWFHWSAVSFAWVQDDGSPGAPLGMWGYGLRALEIAGFTGGSLLGPAVLRSKPYCEACSRYMKVRREALIPASVPARKIKKNDTEAQLSYDQEQQATLEEAMAAVESLGEMAGTGDSSGFRALLTERAGDAKSAGKLPVRFQVQMSSCPGCHAGELKTSLQSGHGDRQQVEELSRLALRAHFVNEVAG